MTRQLPDEAKERMDRFFQRYEAEHPYAICLLKGHLLAEECLEEIIVSVCKCPDAALDAKMSFYSKLRLAQAIDGSETPMWNCLEKLNVARNELAHGRNMEHLEGKIDKFVNLVRESFPEISLENSRADDLELAVVALNGALSRIAAG